MCKPGPCDGFRYCRIHAPLLGSSRHQTAPGTLCFLSHLCIYTFHLKDCRHHLRHWKSGASKTWQLQRQNLGDWNFVAVFIVPVCVLGHRLKETQLHCSQESWICKLSSNIHMPLPTRLFQVHGVCRAVQCLVSLYSIDHWCSLRKLLWDNKQTLQEHTFWFVFFSPTNKISTQRKKTEDKN